MSMVFITYIGQKKSDWADFARLSSPEKSKLYPHLLRTLLFLLCLAFPAIDAVAQSFIVHVDSFTDLSSNNPAVAGHGYPFTITRDSGSGQDATYSGTHTLNFSPAAVIPQVCAPVASDCSTRTSCQPASGALDISFSGGKVDLCIVMPDVGAYSFSVTEGGATGASPGFVSRPSYFALADISLVRRGDLPLACNSTFTYMSEPMKLTFTLTAMSEENLATPSYDGTKLNGAVTTSANWTAPIGNGSMGLLMTGVDSHRVSVASSSANWSNGAGIISADVNFARDSTPDGPYPNVAIGIAPQDDDGVSLRQIDLNMDGNSDGTNDRVSLGTTVLRYGRLKIANAYGSDVLPLPVNVQAQYWSGTAFVNNTDDNCTPLDGNFVLGQVGALPQPNTSVGATTGKLSNGEGKVALNKPSTALVTKAITSIKTNDTNLPYLPGLGTGTFGVYRSGPVIYRRELHY